MKLHFEMKSKLIQYLFRNFASTINELPLGKGIAGAALEGTSFKNQ